jgi:hypothetical protein
MYSEKVIEKKLDDFAAAERWRPVRHTLEQVLGFKKYIESITKVDSNTRNSYVEITRSLSAKRQQEIRRFIQNEQIMCSFDSAYFENNYAYICDEKGEIFKFKNRKSQDVFDNILSEFDDLQVAIELFILKARQVGISTKVALKFLHRLLFIPHTQAAMASVKQDKSELIARILTICFERLPWWLVPRSTTDRIKLWGWENGSILSIQSGGQPTGVAQGWTPTCTHISEVGDIRNPKKVLEEGLLRATHPTRKLFQVFEGTGNGSTGWQADKWRSCKEDWPRGRSRLRPIFISYPLATDLYPEPDFIRKFPIPECWEPCSETRKHVRKAELFICSTDYLSKICGSDWRMPRDMQWYWEFNYLEAVKSHTQKIWLSQMPADDIEALTGKNDLVFDSEVIEVSSNERKREFQSYAIVGDSIDDGFEPATHMIDYEQARIPISWESHRGQKYNWLLVPLLPFDEEEERNSLDKVLIFEEPIAGADYTIGIDTADGLGKEDEERASCSVSRYGGDGDHDIQAAELTSNRMNPPQMVGFVACLGAYFGRQAKDPRGCKICAEQRMRPGDDCQFQLKMMGFTWHHTMTRYDSKHVKETAGQKEGWYSNAWSVPFLMNRFIEAVNNKWYKPNSKYLIAELRDLERKIAAGGKSKMEHQSGKFDDRVRAAAHAYITRHAFDILAERAQKRYACPTAKLPEVNYEPCNYAQVSVGE